jgi:hypothetical protein
VREGLVRSGTSGRHGHSPRFGRVFVTRRQPRTTSFNGSSKIFHAVECALMRKSPTGSAGPAFFLLAAIAATTFGHSAAAQQPEPGAEKEPASEAPATQAAGGDEVAPAAETAGEPAPTAEPDGASRAEPDAEPVPSASPPPPLPPASPPVAATMTGPVEATTEQQSWFCRPPLRAVVGEGSRRSPPARIADTCCWLPRREPPKTSVIVG